MNNKEYRVESIAEFDREESRLVKKKKFFKLPYQIDELISQLEKGEFAGTLIGHSDSPVSHDIYKLRLPNPDTQDGKSNGYRVIYLVVTKEKIVALLVIYYKKEQADLTDTYIQWLVDGFFLGALPFDENDDDENNIDEV